MSDDEGPPPVQDAHRRPPPRRAAQSGIASGRGAAAAKRMDPRFDPMFGKVDVRHFEQHYKFLREEEEKEEVERRFKIKCLKCVLRRAELEEAGEDLDEYDLSDYEQEVFGEDHQRDLRAMKLTPPQHLYKELAQLQRASQLYTARTRDDKVKDRHATVKKELLKKEVQAVKAGTKSKPFFPKRAEVKKAMLADTFTHLNDKGGKAAVDRYLMRKQKK